MTSLLLPDSINESSIIECSKLDEPLFRTFVTILSSTRDIINKKLSILLESPGGDETPEFNEFSNEWRYVDRLYNIATAIKSL